MSSSSTVPLVDIIQKINEDFLLVLKKNEQDIFIDTIPIDKHFINQLENIRGICNKNYDNTQNIINFLKGNTELKILEKHYKYCFSLDGSFQGITANIESLIKGIIQSRDLIYSNKKKNDAYNLDENISKLQIGTLNNIENWIKAFNIEKTYRKCFENKSILTFSHRINGWSNPTYELTKDFNIEFKTNFGYGGASYFYIKIKYKNIEITPVSEWIDYEWAQFSEIIRYTKSFANQIYRGNYDGRNVFRKVIENKNWKEAIEYAKDACNCSLKSEVEFIKSYVVDECEKMLSGLEYILENSKFTFIGEQNEHYTKDKKSHELMEFRGEKISGSLDFISKILEFKSIAEITSFIQRIELCNSRIQPFLPIELQTIEKKLIPLNNELELITPVYQELIKQNQQYIKDRNSLLRELIINKEIDNKAIDHAKLSVRFKEKYPEFEEFEIKFNTINQRYKSLTETIQNLKIVYGKIEGYNLKILNYFSNK